MNIVKKHFLSLSILFTFLLSASVAECIIPQPYRIGGTVTVDGIQLTQASDSGYTFVVTESDGNDFDPEALDEDGLNGSNWYLIDIPLYDANDQPRGANPGDPAVIHVYRNREELMVRSPTNGSITVEDVGSLQLINLTVESPYTPPAQFTLSASVSGGEGSVSPTSGTYDEGTLVSLIATPEEDYRVTSWSGTDNDGSEANTNTVTMDSNKTVTVSFEEIPPPQYTLTAYVAGGEGSISPTSGTYNEGTVVPLIATPEEGYCVASWSGTDNDGSDSNANTVTMDSDKTVMVSFEEIPPAQYTLTVHVPRGNGSVSPTSGVYDEGAMVRLIARPDNGYRVASWSGTDNDRSDSTVNTVIMNANRTVVVTFTEIAVPVITRFTVTPSEINQGETAVLIWSITGADSANINNGIGSVDASGGSVNVSPDTTTIYILTATNSGGRVSASLSLTVEEEVPPDPQPPIADAGPDQVINEGTIVMLSGLNSTDPDGTIVSFFWEQTAGELVDLSDPWVPEISFPSPDVGMNGESLSFQLTVVDNDDLESSSECIINVIWVNEPPEADAGPDQSVFSGDEVVLDASMSSDVDDGIATYSWEQIDGTPVSLCGGDSVQAVFVAPDVSDAGDALTFALTVWDNGNLKAVDTCVVNVESWTNSPPIANAGPDQEVNEHDIVTLDGSGSMDCDDGILSYIWTQKAGTPVKLSNTLVAKPTFNAPEVKKDGEILIFKLTVIDRGGLKSTDRCRVRVNQSPSDPSLSIFWVDSLKVELKGKGLYHYAMASMTVLDENLKPVKGAITSAVWTFNEKKTSVTLGVTNKNGEAKLYSRLKKVKSGDVFTVKVTGIIKKGYVYDPSSNSATTESIIVPKSVNNRPKKIWYRPPFFGKRGH